MGEGAVGDLEATRLLGRLWPLVALVLVAATCQPPFVDDFGVAIYVRNGSASTVYVRSSSNEASPVLVSPPGSTGFGEFTAPGEVITVFDPDCSVLAVLSAPSTSGPVVVEVSAAGAITVKEQAPSGEPPLLSTEFLCRRDPLMSQAAD